MIEMQSLREGYEDLCRMIRDKGDKVSPRGKETRELRAVTLRIWDSSDTLPHGIDRMYNPGVGAVEALQLIGGFSNPEAMVATTENFTHFKRSGAFDGAYGPRIRTQLPKVVDRLRRDWDTRQAIIQIWDPQHDLFEDHSKDYPCTLNLHVLVRDEKVELHTDMRSNDVWWGLAYDAFQFSQLQWTIANVLGLQAGPYYHHATSLHMYMDDWPKIESLGPPLAGKILRVRGVGVPNLSNVRDVQERAEYLVGGEITPLLKETPSEEWFRETMRRYIHP